MQFVYLAARSKIAARKWNASACKPNASFGKTLPPLSYSNDAHDRQLAALVSHFAYRPIVYIGSRQLLQLSAPRYYCCFWCFCYVLLLSVVGNCCCRLTSQPAITRISWNFNFALFRRRLWHLSLPFAVSNDSWLFACRLLCAICRRCRCCCLYVKCEI